MVIDLQAHTTASDGTLTPQALVELAVRERVDVLAVTDHDTTDGIAAATAAGQRAGVRIVAGIELSATHEGGPVHVLGLFCDPADAALGEALAGLRAERFDRAARMVQRLEALGYAITMEDVIAQSGGRVVGRPHVARALVARGYIPSVSAAFTPALIADGGRADVARRDLSPSEAVEMLVAARAVPVLAHPGHIDRDVRLTLASHLKPRGLAGIEVDHPDHTHDVRAELRAFASARNLVPTGGSDFHEPGARRLGQCTTHPDAFAQLEAIASGA